MRLTYPIAPSDDTTDNYHGTIVPDPFRPLEDDTVPAVVEWVEAQNRLTRSVLDSTELRERFEKRLKELSRLTTRSTPLKAGKSLIYTESDGESEQPVLFIQHPDGSRRILLDVNTLSDNGTASLGFVSPSPDGRFVACGICRSGSDDTTIEVIDTTSGKFLSDKIGKARFTDAEWCGDSFFYSRYDKDALDTAPCHKVCRHRLGTPADTDEIIYREPHNPDHYLTPFVGDDKSHLFITVSEGTGGSAVIWRPTDSDGEFTPLLNGFVNEHIIIGCSDGKLFILTDMGADNRRVISITLDGTARITDVIAESDRPIEAAAIGGDYIFAHYLDDAASMVLARPLCGGDTVRIPLPDLGSVSNIEASDNGLYYTFANRLTPSTIYRYDPHTNILEPFFTPETPVDTTPFVTERIMVDSGDVRIPVFITRRRDIPFDGGNRCLLYGYGGFNISLTPSYSAWPLMFVEAGGVYVEASLRGGGEYGESWHRAGMLENKHNVFDDFAAVARYLKEKGYTSTENLAVMGGSNGGLLVGATITRTPDICAVAIARVGVLDMLRYHLFTVGRGWVVEYGSSEDAAHFKNLLSYSPLHNIKEGTHYPATLIMTADHDDRVVPAHSFKFAATLQRAQGGNKPILLRVDSQAGHGAGKPLSKLIAENADIYAFLFENTPGRDTRTAPK